METAVKNTRVEEWRPVVGFEGRYEVSSLGRVRSLDQLWYAGQYGKTPKHKKGRVIVLVADINGYTIARLSNKKFYIRKVHRLVAEAFIDNPEGKSQVNHKDGNKQNNRVENLEWVTPSENQKHSYDVLKRARPQGEIQGQSKLKNQDVLNIRHLHKMGLATREQLAEQYKVSKSNITHILNRSRWNHL